jgi:hypothetical protein
MLLADQRLDLDQRDTASAKFAEAEGVSSPFAAGPSPSNLDKRPSPFLRHFSLHCLVRIAQYSERESICGRPQMKSVITVCTCIIILYLLDAAFFNGVYFVGVSRMLSDMLSHFR